MPFRYREGPDNKLGMRYSAGKSQGVFKTQVIGDIKRMGRLTVPGILLDSLSKIGDKITTVEASAEILYRTTSPELLQTRWTYNTNEEVLDAFWRTILVDMNITQTERMTEEDCKLYGRAFRAILGLESLKSRLSLIQVLKNKFSPEVQVAIRQLRAMFKFREGPSFPFRFAVTKKGLFTMVPEMAKGGDVVGILYGASVPYVFRPSETDSELNTYKIVGMAYVHDLMDGEGFKARDEGRFEERVFNLV